MSLLVAAYTGAVLMGVFCTTYWWSSFVVAATHSLFCLRLWQRSRLVDLGDNESIYSFYMFIWKLFYLEYFCLPFVR